MAADEISQYDQFMACFFSGKAAILIKSTQGDEHETRDLAGAWPAALRRGAGLHLCDALALRHQPILIEGTVVQALGPSSGADTAVLQVQRQFKGNTPAQIQIGETMCMRTVWAKDMKPGQTYIVSLAHDKEQLAMFERLHAQHEQRAPSTRYALAPCAESALLREGDDLFNFVIGWNPAGERKLEKTFYAKYQDFVRKSGLQPAKPASEPRAR